VKTPSPFGRLLLPLYLPTVLVSTSETAMLLLLPLYVIGLGYGPALAALIVGARGVGLLLFDLPSGMLASRFGDRFVLLLGLALNVSGLAIIALSTSPWLLGFGASMSGAGASAWMLGRQLYIADICSGEETGRAIAVMAGLQRVGIFIGPALGGMLVAATSYSWTFLAAASLAIVATAFVRTFSEDAQHGALGDSVGLALTIRLARQHARLFLTAGGAALSLQLMRATRTLLVPLFGVAIGLDEASIGLIYSLSAGIDMCLFYPVGALVDRHGRKWSAVPSLTLFATALFVLPLASGFKSLLFVAGLLGLANGLGTGIVMIIGADLARRSDNRSQFLGVWRLIGDIGMSGAPLVSAALVSVASLGAASVFAASLGVVGALLMLMFVPETLERSRSGRRELP
jgi:MFS family permease